jgi:hypothetical protein
MFFAGSAASTDWNRILDSFQQTIAEFQDALSLARRRDSRLESHAEVTAFLNELAVPYRRQRVRSSAIRKPQYASLQSGAETGFRSV